MFKSNFKSYQLFQVLCYVLVLVLRFKDKIYRIVLKLNYKPDDLGSFILRINLGFQDKFYGIDLRPLFK